MDKTKTINQGDTLVWAARNYIERQFVKSVKKGMFFKSDVYGLFICTDVSSKTFSIQAANDYVQYNDIYNIRPINVDSGIIREVTITIGDGV